MKKRIPGLVQTSHWGSKKFVFEVKEKEEGLLLCEWVCRLRPQERREIASK